LAAIVKELAESIPAITFDRCHLSALGDYSLNFEMVYYVDGSDFNGYMDLQQKIYLAILEKFEREKIEL
jgi:small-conductance mechanosensitive channel